MYARQMGSLGLKIILFATSRNTRERISGLNV
jgi:hypothetical protein